MKLSVTRDNLHAGLGAVSATIPTKTTLPVLSNILVEAEDGKLTLSGTDLDISVSVTIEADVTEPGSVTVPARKFAEIVRELAAAPVHVETDGVEIRIESGKSRFKLFGLAPDEFPGAPEIDFADSWKMDASLVQELISRTSFAVSTEESRPILNGVLWQLKPDSAVMVATNGHRLAKMTIELSGTGTPPETDLIVPPKALQQVQRLFDDEGEIELAHSRNHLAFRSPSRLVYTRLIEGPYPNYQQVIPTDNDRIATANRDNLAAAIRRMAVVASDQTHRVRMSFEDGSLSFRVQTPDLGEAEEEMAVDYQGDALEIGFNANYLLEVLKYMPDDDVIMQFKAPERAATFLPASGAPDYLCLVMPLRLLD